MFNRKPAQPTQVEEALTECYANLKGFTPETPEHSAILEQIIKLEEIKNKHPRKFKMPSADAMLTAGASLLGILLILNYERTEVITTKAMGLLHKPKI